jgi:glycerophosphoryl diester phosphodiesterase
MNKKKWLLISALTKIPFLIYLVITISTIPQIDAIEYDTILGAHRGDSLEYTENSLEAIESALENPDYQFIEFDVRYTKDRKAVVFHDASLLRMEGDSSKLIDLTYEELQSKTDFTIPLYSDILNTIGDKRKINIEIKTSGDEEIDKELVEFIVQDLESRSVVPNVMISSPKNHILKHVKTLNSDIKTGKVYWVTLSTYLNYSFVTENIYEEVEEVDANYILLHGANIHNIETLVELKPEDTTLCFWYFTNEVHIVQVDDSDRLW